MAALLPDASGAVLMAARGPHEEGGVLPSAGDPFAAAGEGEESMEGFWGEPIHVYTRAQALGDGVLVDVTQTAWEAGFRVPVALTANVWADVREIPRSKRGIEGPDGRLWDLLWMGRLAAGRTSNQDRHTITYALHLDTGEGRRRRRVYRARLHIGPGDAGEPVVTLTRPEED